MPPPSPADPGPGSAAVTAGHHLLATAIAWLEAGHRVAVVTVIETWGASPRPVGSLLVVRDDGAFEGSISGGCIEAEAVSEALDVIEEGAPRTVEYGISDSQAHGAGLSCGGRLRLHLRVAAAPEPLRTLLARRPAALVHGLSHEAFALVTPAGIEGDLELDEDRRAAVTAAVAGDRSGLVDTARGPAFVLVVSAPPRLVVVGAVHIAQSLVPMAEMVGLAVTVVDPRPAFATTARLPGVTLSPLAPDRAIAQLAPDSHTAVVTLTHDAALVDAALVAALGSPAFYVGALGSRRTHAKRLERLRRRGIAEGDLDRIKGPVGLDLGGRQPAEIALAIAAEVVAARYGRAPARA